MFSRKFNSLIKGGKLSTSESSTKNRQPNKLNFAVKKQDRSNIKNN